MNRTGDTTQYITNLFSRNEFNAIACDAISNGLPDVDLTPIEGHLLAMLTRMIGAKTAVEFGTLAGYSAAYIASALPLDGKLITYEIEPRYAEIAKNNLWKATKVYCSVRNEDAHEAIKTLDGTFDLCFIDADKAGYDDYLTWALAHVRVGGLIVAHNALWHGKVVSFMSIPYGDTTDDTTQALRAFNVRVASETRLQSIIIPLGDGLLVAQVVK